MAALTRHELSYVLSNGDLRRLQLYAQNMVDHHLITDLIPAIARLYFTDRLDVCRFWISYNKFIFLIITYFQLKLSAAQSAIVVGVGLQHQSLDRMATSLGLPASQVMAMYNKTMRKFMHCFNGICEKAVEQKVRLYRN